MTDEHYEEKKVSVQVNINHILVHKPIKGEDVYYVYYGVRIFRVLRTQEKDWFLSIKTIHGDYAAFTPKRFENLQDTLEHIEKASNNGITTGVRDCRRKSDNSGIDNS
jgi:hypothetical protein